MSQRKGRIAVVGVAVAAAVVVVAGGAQAAGNAGIADNTVDSNDLKNGGINQVDLSTGLYNILRTPNQDTVTGWSIKDGSIQLTDIAPAARAALKGDPGASAILTVTADTMVTGRPDTATDGSIWADDSMTRTLTVVRQHAATSTDCGEDAVKCWFYTGTIKDNGTFKTRNGAHGPNSTTEISGVVNGTVNGVYEIEFFASSDKPNSALVDSTVIGDEPTTSDWMKMAFPAGTKFHGFHGVDYTWVYTAPATCETHTQKTHSNTGDILGVNHCP